MTNQDIYNLADMLGMTLSLKNDKLAGASKRSVEIGGLTVPVGLKVVSSSVTGDDAILLCRGPGNMVMLAAAGLVAGPGIVAILDASKMEEPDGLLERKKSLRIDPTLAMLSQAIVVAFKKRGHGKWSKF